MIRLIGPNVFFLYAYAICNRTTHDARIIYTCSTVAEHRHLVLACQHAIGLGSKPYCFFFSFLDSVCGRDFVYPRLVGLFYFQTRIVVCMNLNLVGCCSPEYFDCILFVVLSAPRIIDENIYCKHNKYNFSIIGTHKLGACHI